MISAARRFAPSSSTPRITRIPRIPPGRAAHVADATAMRAGGMKLVSASAPGTQPLVAHLHQAEMADAAHLDARAVVLQRLRQATLHHEQDHPQPLAARPLLTRSRSGLGSLRSWFKPRRAFEWPVPSIRQSRAALLRAISTARVRAGSPASGRSRTGGSRDSSPLKWSQRVPWSKGGGTSGAAGSPDIGRFLVPVTQMFAAPVTELATAAPVSTLPVRSDRSSSRQDRSDHREVPDVVRYSRHDEPTPPWIKPRGASDSGAIRLRFSA